MKKTIILILAGITVLSFSCCSNDDTTEKEQEAQEAAIRESLKTQGIMNALCEIDSIENGTLTYTPRIGVALEPSTPTIFYTIGYDLTYARSTFQSIISSLNFSEEDNMRINEIRQEDIHLTFSESTASGEIARIKVDCPKLKNVLTEIVFIPEERWPTNDNASPFNLLSIWKYDGLFYVCVKKAESESGIMLNLDGVPGREEFKEDTYWQGSFSLYKPTASAEAFDCLVYLMNNRPNAYSKMVDKMIEAGGHKMWKDIIGGSRDATFARGFRAKSGLWCFHYCWYVDLDVTDIRGYGSSHYTIHRTIHYEHKETPYYQRANSEIRFNTWFNKYGWECIYKGT